MGGLIGLLAVVADLVFMAETLPKLEGQSALANAYHRIGGSAPDVTVHDEPEANGSAHGGAGGSRRQRWEGCW